MKRKIALCVMLMMSMFCTPVLAASDYDLLYDATELLDSDYCEKVGEEKLPALSKKYKTQIRVDIVRDLEGNTIDQYAQIFYEQYEYGYGDTKDGILLMLYLTEDDTGLAFEEYYLLSGGTHVDELYNLALRMDSNMNAWLNADAWSGTIDDDNLVFEEIMEAYMHTAEAYFANAQPYASVSAETEAYADPELDLVSDSAAILTQAEAATLEEKAQKISETYKCNVYIVTVDDYSAYGNSVYEAAKTIYQTYHLGYGTEKDGVMLLLSMNDRDYSLIAFGYGNTAFTDYGKEQLEEEFLDDLGDNEWAEGFSDYLDKSAEMLKTARAGKPLDVGSNPMIQIVGFVFNLILGAGVAFLASHLLKSTMNSVHEKEEAEAYVTEGGVSFRRRDDRYLYSNESRRLIKKDSGSSSGGTSVDSDGFSGSSGKF